MKKPKAMKTDKSDSVVNTKTENTDEQNQEKIPEIKEQYMQLINLREKLEKLIRIGEMYYLITEHEIHKCTETILSKKFVRGQFKNGSADHLVYSGAFVVRKKLLQIEISFKMKSGLLGDYLDVKGSYDDVSIGDFHALRSYAGGGANGTWPTLNGESWAVRFILTQPSHEEPEGCFSILYFECIKSFRPTTAEKTKVGSIPLKGVGDFLIQNKFNLEEIKEHRKTIWSITVPENEACKKPGELSMCIYPGFQQYKKNYTRKLFPREFPFVSFAISECNLLTIEYDYEDNREQLPFWDSIAIKSNEE